MLSPGRSLTLSIHYGNPPRRESITRSPYEIMALHGHGDPKASEIYTRSVDRRKLVESAMGRIDLGTIIE
jgi:hypothetical protein